MEATVKEASIRFSVHLSPEQAQVFEAFRRKQGATKASLMELALVEFFARRGVTFPEWEDRITA